MQSPVIVVIAVWLFGTACAAVSLGRPTPRSDDQPVRESVAEVNKQFDEAFRNNDPERVASLYTEKGELLFPNGSIVRGRKAIAAYWKKAMESGVRSVKLTTVEVEADGITAYEVGNYSLLGKGAGELGRGKYLVIWKQEGGKWRLHRDCWNSDRGRTASNGLSGWPARCNRCLRAPDLLSGAPGRRRPGGSRPESDACARPCRHHQRTPVRRGTAAEAGRRERTPDQHSPGAHRNHCR